MYQKTFKWAALGFQPCHASKGIWWCNAYVGLRSSKQAIVWTTWAQKTVWKSFCLQHAFSHFHKSTMLLLHKNARFFTKTMKPLWKKLITTICMQNLQRVLTLFFNLVLELLQNWKSFRFFLSKRKKPRSSCYNRSQRQ